MAGSASMNRRPEVRKVSSEQRLFLTVLLSAVPVIGLLVIIFLNIQPTFTFKLVLTAFCALWLIALAASIRETFVYHLRTLSNLIEAIRTEDYSMRSSRIRDPGELAELYHQIATLTDQLKRVREDEFELSNLLERIINQINVAIVACDSEGNVRLANRLAKKLLEEPTQLITGKALSDTPLRQVLSEDGSRLIDHDFPGASGRWQINQQQYRHHGKPGKIIFITDLKQVLSEEEVNAWQRLIRVIAHEVNNSLTPINSICQTLDSYLSQMEVTENTENLREGLGVIEDRAKGLRDFISVYARIAKLPEPHKINFSVKNLLQKVGHFFSSEPVDVAEEVVDITLFGDPVHIEQILINLIKNALEASSKSEHDVKVSCRKQGAIVEFLVIDSGSGISNPANLFVPFYTTKDKGAGIGLTLARQMAAKHRGQLILENRSDGDGAIAKLQIPTATP